MEALSIMLAYTCNRELASLLIKEHVASYTWPWLLPVPVLLYCQCHCLPLWNILNYNYETHWIHTFCGHNLRIIGGFLEHSKCFFGAVQDSIMGRFLSIIRSPLTCTNNSAVASTTVVRALYTRCLCSRNTI